MRTWARTAAAPAAGAAAPGARGAGRAPDVDAPRLAMLSRPPSSITSSRSFSRVRSDSSTRPVKSGRSLMPTRPSATVRKGWVPKRGSSATSNPFSRTEGVGNALTENEAKRTGRPSTWLAACAI